MCSARLGKTKARSFFAKKRTLPKLVLFGFLLGGFFFFVLDETQGSKNVDRRLRYIPETVPAFYLPCAARGC